MDINGRQQALNKQVNTNGNNYFLGAGNTGAAEAWEGGIAENIVYGSPLSGADQARVNFTWLSNMASPWMQIPQIPQSIITMFLPHLPLSGMEAPTAITIMISPAWAGTMPQPCCS